MKYKQAFFLTAEITVTPPSHSVLGAIAVYFTFVKKMKKFVSPLDFQRGSAQCLQICQYICSQKTSLRRHIPNKFYIYL